MIKHDKLIKYLYIEDIKSDRQIEHKHNRLIKIMFKYTLVSSINKMFQTK